MPYIRTISPSEAAGKLKEVHECGSGPSAARGKVSMIRQVQSLNPSALAPGVRILIASRVTKEG
jgi:hypothetical protein